MAESEAKIAELEARLESLVRTQIDFQVEVTAIRRELTRLRGEGKPTTKLAPDPPAAQPPRLVPPPSAQVTAEAKTDLPPKWSTAAQEASEARPVDAPTLGMKGQGQSAGDTHGAKPSFVDEYVENAQANLEKFIGENLISKIGIIVLVVGVGIGAKYAIDNGWVSPLLRIILGYLVGVVLLGAAIKLKPKYHNFSAVLLSGSLAVMYFITYFAYSAYGLMPQPVAFAVMTVLTVFTVAAAVLYDRQVIAHIGLVGGYAVPFLLSNNSGNYLFLFIYMTILNLGILSISLKRRWKPIFYTASGFTWLIFGAWFATSYRAETHFYLALVFTGVFFAIFYVTKLIHPVIHGDEGHSENLISLIATTVIFFGFSYGLNGARYGWVDQTSFAVELIFVAVVSLVLLLTSYRIYGRSLIYVVYPMAWVMYGSWFFTWYKPEEHFMLAAVMAGIYFLVFYGATLVYRLATDELGMAENIAMVMTNSFVFYGFGYLILDSRPPLQRFEGLYTASHGVLHSLTAHIVGRLKSNATDLVQTLAVLIITFATIAIPIQFDGSLITLIWAVEAAALFYFGRRRGVDLFEYLSYPVMLLGICSMAGNWIQVYASRSLSADPALLRQPFANGEFVTGLVFVGAWACVCWVKRARGKILDDASYRLFSTFASTVAVFALYNVLRMEIGNYFRLQWVSGVVPSVEMDSLNIVVQLNYTVLFLAVMSFVILRRRGPDWAAAATVALSVIVLVVVAVFGMIELYNLQQTYTQGWAVGLFGLPSVDIGLRYVTYTLSGALLVMLYEFSRTSFLDEKVPRASRSVAYDALVYPLLLIFASCELINIAEQLRVNDANKYGLTILWGMFALAVVAIGIWKGRKHLRIAAMVLLGITLAKLFFYDISELETIPKTLLFMAVGVLFLLISFLYNKYKTVIFGPDVEATEE